jgi:transposase InsO family protein
MFNSEIISYALSKRLTGEAVLSALDKAIKVTNDCQPRRTFHSDQGRSYQMINYRKTLKIKENLSVDVKEGQLLR